MSGIVFDHFNRYLRVVFHPVEYGMVPFDLVSYDDATATALCDDQCVRSTSVSRARYDPLGHGWRRALDVRIVAGEKLRELRSPPVDAWLADRTSVCRPRRASR